MQKLLLSALTLTFLLAPPAFAADPALSSAQQTEVEDIVRKLLTEKEPDIIAKAAQVLQQRSQAQQAQTSLEAVEKNKDKLLNDPNTPVLGNPKGDVTIVEFFDYQCGYCKMAHPAIKDILAKDKNVRFVAKEYAILGDASLLASRAAVASVKQKKYDKFHDALMGYHGQYTEASVMELATKAGLDADQLKRDMNDKTVDDTISGIRKLGADIGVRGTPFFIIGSTVRPGAMNAQELEQAVADARKGKK